jgi:hypothetical protein
MTLSVDSGVRLHWHSDADRTAFRDHIELLRKIASASA